MSSKAQVIRFTERLGTPKTFLKKVAEFIRESLSDEEKVVCALSGGVDSTVTAEIFRRAIGGGIYPIHFDTGFMRRINGIEEVELVRKDFEDFENFQFVDKKEEFYKEIFDIENSEEKRKNFRRTYESALNEKIEEIGAKTITQGTIRPDILETEGKIKSQNNVDTNFKVEKLVEPLAGLYKPDVRRLGKALGFSRKKYMRQPFLGPGLSARSVGAITMDKLEVEKEANDIVEQYIEEYFEKNYGRNAIWDDFLGVRIPFQYFSSTFDNEKEKDDEISEYLEDTGIDAIAYSLKNKATGVKEENGKRKRVYAPPVLLKGEVEGELAHHLGREIPEKFSKSRVLLQLNEPQSKPNWIISIRAIYSKDALIASPLRIPMERIEELGKMISQKTNSSIAAYDVTPKPPATIEYE